MHPLVLVFIKGCAAYVLWWYISCIQLAHRGFWDLLNFNANTCIKPSNVGKILYVNLMVHSHCVSVFRFWSHKFWNTIYHGTWWFTYSFNYNCFRLFKKSCKPWTQPNMMTAAWYCSVGWGMCSVMEWISCSYCLGSAELLCAKWWMLSGLYIICQVSEFLIIYSTQCSYFLNFRSLKILFIIRNIQDHFIYFYIYFPDPFVDIIGKLTLGGYFTCIKIQAMS